MNILVMTVAPAVVAAIRQFILRNIYVPALSPDGAEYLKMAVSGNLRKETVPAPFCNRHALPIIFRNGDPEKVKSNWGDATSIAHVVAPALMAVLLYLLGCSQEQSAFGGCLLALLPGFLGVSIVFPILTEPISMATNLFAACLWFSGDPALMVVGALIAIGSVFIHEHNAVINAILLWNPIPLLGLLLWYGMSDSKSNYWVCGPRKTDEDWRTVVRFRGVGFFDPLALLLPWGVCLVAFFNMSPQLAVALMAGYAGLFVANDTQRVYTRIAPLMILATVPMVPVEFMIPALVGQWCLLYVGQDKRKPPGV